VYAGEVKNNNNFPCYAQIKIMEENMGATFIYKDKKDCTIDESPQAFFAKLLNIEAERRGLASAGKQAGMTEADILGLSASLVAVGIRAEMGGTAFSKAMNRINIAVQTGNEELENFAMVAGLSTQEFADLFNRDASSALIAFVQGLSDVERHGKNTIVLMDEIGLTEVRLSDALRRAAGSGELFSKAIEMSNTAFEDNTALQNEAQIRYATTESQMQLLTNATNQLKIAIGDALAPAMRVGTEGLTDFSLGAAKFLKQNQWLTQSLTVLSVALGTMVGTITIYGLAVKALTAAKAALGITTVGTTATIKAFGAALAASPVAPVVLALTALATAATIATIAMGEHTKAQEEARQRAKSAIQEYENESRVIKQLESQINDEGVSRKSLISIMTSHNVRYKTELEYLTDINAVRERSIELLEEENKRRAKETIRETGSEYENVKKDIEENVHYLAVFRTQLDEYDELRRNGELKDTDWFTRFTNSLIELTGHTAFYPQGTNEAYEQLTETYKK